MPLNQQKSSRILALDILRGITICGMILVNNPGSWGKLYAPLDHAEWIGLTPTDLVFPFFMFIMGMSMFISLQKYDFSWSKDSARKIITRTVGIYLVGWLIGLFSHFCRYWGHPDESLTFGQQILDALYHPNFRITGVLARLAICYGICATLVLSLRHRLLPWLIAVLFVGYFIILQLGNGFVYGPENILSIVDRAILGENHLYNDNGIDPEGLLSTLPSIGHTLIGFCIGRALFSKSENVALSVSDPNQKLLKKMEYLFIVGFVLSLSGWLLSYGCPLSKKIWTPTFSLVTCGLAASLFAFLIYIVDIRKKTGCWSRFFEAFGVNPLFLFIVSDFWAILFGAVRTGIMNGDHNLTIHGLLYKKLFSPIFGDYGGSLAYAIFFILFNWLFAYWLWKKKIYIKF